MAEEKSPAAKPKRERMTVAEEKALRAEVEQLRRERYVLAQLAAKEPQFDNPLVAWAAEELRDRILAGGRPQR